MIFTVICPGCKNHQKTNPKGDILTGKVKRCVYCGKNFKIHSSIINSQIIKKSD